MTLAEIIFQIISQKYELSIVQTKSNGFRIIVEDHEFGQTTIAHFSKEEFQSETVLKGRLMDIFKNLEQTRRRFGR